MDVVYVDRREVNLDRLDEDLRRSLSDVYLGAVQRPDEIEIHLTDAANNAHRVQVRQIVDDHNPALLSRRLTAARARQLALKADRAAHATELDLSAFDAQPDLIQTLVRRIRWLEREIRDLRGLE